MSTYTYICTQIPIFDSSSPAIAIANPCQAPWIVSVNFSAHRSSVRAPRSVRSTLWTASIA